MNQMQYFELLVRQVRDEQTVESALSWAMDATPAEISAQIDRLKTERATKPTIALVNNDGKCHHGNPINECIGAIEVGMYRKADGRMFRVYPARNGGHLLTKELVPGAMPTETGYGFEYRGAAGRFVSACERMTLDEAKAWGAQYGTCCVCAAFLTDPTSVAAGIGPICGGRV